MPAWPRARGPGEEAENPMQILERVVNELSYYIWSFGIPVGGETVPLVVVALLGTGLFMTLRLGLIQVRRLGHGFAVTSGKYDVPNEPGDVSHFQALTTALSGSGLSDNGFLFLGFLPAKKSQRQKALSALRDSRYPVVLYEAPRRIEGLLSDALEVLGDRKTLLPDPVGTLEACRTLVADGFTVVGGGDSVAAILNGRRRGFPARGPDERRVPKGPESDRQKERQRVRPHAQVAQSVEQGIENPRVGSSILSLGTIRDSKG